MNNRGGKQGQAGGKKFGKFPFNNQKKPPPKVNISTLKCPACDFTCMSAQNLRIHIQTNHKELENQSQNESAMAVVPPGKIPEHIRRSVFTLKDYVYRMDREPIIGLEHILEYRLQVQPDKIEIKYFCDLCQLDSDLVTMLEHLCSFRHRKMYMSKQYPYVLKAPSSSKEDRMQFMRRMAMEIEQEEGTRMYKSYPIIKTTPMKSTAAKPARLTTRWDSEGDKEKRMKKALEYLQSFEIDNDSEAGTVTRLTEKLTAELKCYSDKLKEEALFPAKVARAKDVAMSIMQKAAKNRNPGQKKQMQKAPQARPGGPPPPVVNKPFQNPNPAFQQPPPQGPPQPFQPPNQRPNYPMPPGNTQPAMPNVPPPTDQTPEEMKFLKKLMTLLKVLPQSSGTMPQTSQFNSKLMMLKSLLQDKAGSMPSNQLTMQVASLTQEMANMNNASLTQQWTSMSSQDTGNAGQLGPNAMMQMASVANAQPNSNVLTQIAALLQNRQANANTLPENRNTCNQQFMQMDNSSRRPMDQGPYQQPYANMGYNSGMYGGNQDCADYSPEEAPYRRVSLSPRAQRGERFQDNNYDHDFRRERSQESRSSYGAQSSRPFDDPASAERDRDQLYGKRVKLESDHMTSQSAELGRHYPDEGGSTDAPNLSVDLLKRIRGKDLFTVSAILSEYADN